MKQLKNRAKRGGFNYVSAVLLIVLLAISFVGYTLAPVYYVESQWKRTVEKEILNASRHDDAEIRSRLHEKAEKLGISFSSGDGLHVSRFSNLMTVSYAYEKKTLMPKMRVIKFEKEYQREIKNVQKLFDD
jgi:hypothetical protein